MGKLLQKLLKIVAYVAAAVVIFLALAVGLFRLMLPRLPEYQEEIKDWANAAIGMQVEFSGMNARWRLSGPELTFTDAALVAAGATESLLTAEEVSVGVNLMRFLSDRELVADRVSIRDTEIDLQRNDDGGWLVQGMAFDELRASRAVDAEQAANVLVEIGDLRVNLRNGDPERPFSFTVGSMTIDRNDERTRIRTTIELPEEYGGRLNVTATQRAIEAEPGIWNFAADSRGLELASWSGLPLEGLPVVTGGTADLSLSLRWAGSEWQNASVDFVLHDVGGPEGTALASFGAQGHVEYAAEERGWVLAANRFMLRTVDGDWPETIMQLRPQFAPEGELTGISGSTSFVNLDDLRYLRSWLPDEQRDLLRQLDLSGRIYELSFDVSRLDGESPQFDIAAEFTDAGLAAYGKWPGVRGFSGLIRAATAGGRLEIDSVEITLDLKSQLAEPITFDDAAGTIIWRSNAAGTTVLSDSVRIRNAELDSTSSLQVTIPADGSSPLVDLQSEWSINDIGAAPRYLPAKLINPGLYRWLSAALVSGSMPRGTTRFAGPLDKFPFDNGEGIFRIEAEMLDGQLRYSDKWPASKNMNMNVVVENARLYSVRNSAINAGNSVVNAKVEIADLRKPVLTIDAFATGTLGSIREIALRSPIAGVFGGHLSDINVTGDASFDLQLTLPILDRENYEFMTRIQTSNGTLQFDPFAPPISELNGIVTVTRDEIVADSLFGVFLGEPVDFTLNRMDDESLYSVVAEVSGAISANGLEEAFDTPLDSLLEGAADYRASLRFPRVGQEQAPAFQIALESNLRGIELKLPRPLAKTTDSDMSLALTLEFPGEGRIETIGSLSDSIKWTMDFVREEPRWDFDRGVLAVGGAYPEEPPSRGLHIVGQTELLRLQHWLDLARQGDGRLGLANRIRSIDLVVDNLHLVGQHLLDHRVVVQRSALDWFVEVSGEMNNGSVTVPYDFAGDRPMILDMQRLTLPGSDETDSGDQRQPDPRSFPPIQVRAAEFSLGERHFGALSADFLRTPNGLETSNLETVDDTFTISASAGWVIDVDDSSGQRSFMQASIVSDDVEQTMRRLDYQPGINSKDMEVTMDVSWSGGPRQDLFESLNGEVVVRFGTGQLEEVEPGAGRVFGLMSIVALPRRLSLDFRDVFDRGFGFDEITGSFQLVDGEAYTCDLSLKGPAADVGVVGRASLVEREYDQTVIVSGNLGNTLPVVGAVVAGPQVAAALLIFSQIFKKPLQEMGQLYYGIEGSWDEPLIEASDSERFALSSSLANCIDNSDE